VTDKDLLTEPNRDICQLRQLVRRDITGPQLSDPYQSRNGDGPAPWGAGPWWGLGRVGPDPPKGAGTD
jgi:hypothetical protein